ncbi:DUF1206 domain-containing protein [uncultured Arsenicicoccus sp.]|uniref:DUF1206 domain-containing protein n=1 Tax=uncultured Arsenicicoccus sp. TaxID=491339 RepID=UPI002594146A|nr:DUF1206 domain-containing protein [uncultured Arsenicicoccus sp.]
MRDHLEDVAQAAGDHPATEAAVRTGYAVNGLLHLLIAWICLQLAMLHATGDADQSGALAALSQHTLGRVALWLGVLGFLGLALWQLTEVVVPGLGGDSWQSRLKDGAKAVVYAILAWSAFGFARGTGSSGKQQVQGYTASLLGAPAGRILVAVVGLAIIGVGIYHVVKGLRRRFLGDLEDDPGPLAVYAGMLGYPTRGVALAVVGGLFVAAAMANSSSRTNGLDGALRFLLAQPYGRVVVAFMALGFAAFGVYSFFRARHADV